MTSLSDLHQVQQLLCALWDFLCNTWRCQQMALLGLKTENPAHTRQHAKFMENRGSSVQALDPHNILVANVE
ncbi:hypothetical protein D3C84_968000 [compost metagenome]